MSHIDVSSNISEFFEVAVDDALRSQGVTTTDAARHYVVGVLCDHARFDGPAASTFARPLTFQLRDALTAVGAERFRRLRTLGDGVMYALGFFGANVTRRGANRAYAVSVGATAYDRASAMLRFAGAPPPTGGTAGPLCIDVLAELAHRFERFVDVLTDVADLVLAADAKSSDSGVVALYERWLQTGSERLADELGAIGLVPLRPMGGTN